MNVFIASTEFVDLLRNCQTDRDIDSLLLQESCFCPTCLIIPIISKQQQQLLFVFTGKKTIVNDSWKDENDSLKSYRFILVVDLSQSLERDQLKNDREYLEKIIHMCNFEETQNQDTKMFLFNRNIKSNSKMNKYHILNFISDFLEHSISSWDSLKKNVIQKEHSIIGFVGEFIRNIIRSSQNKNENSEMSVEEFIN